MYEIVEIDNVLILGLVVCTKQKCNGIKIKVTVDVPPKTDGDIVQTGIRFGEVNSLSFL